MTIYDRIRELRINRGFSQLELANKTGYNDRSSIAKIEKGEVDIPYSKLPLFAEALNTTVLVLMGLERKEEEMGKEKIIIKDNLKHLKVNINNVEIKNIISYEIKRSVDSTTLLKLEIAIPQENLKYTFDSDDEQYEIDFDNVLKNLEEKKKNIK